MGRKRIGFALTLAIFLNFLVLFPSSSIPFAQASDYTVARIAKVDYPRTVDPFQSFKIFVTTEYEESFYVDVGILDVEKDEIVQSLTLISNFHGPGEELFVFNLTAPKKEGIWRLEAMTRAWWRNAWYADSSQGIMKFEIQIKKIMRNESTLRAKEIVEISENERIKFACWDDGIESNPRKVLQTSNTTHSPTYTKQLYLEISPPVAFVKGEGWYDEGSMARIEASSKAVIDGKISFFKSWDGDIESDERSTEIQMNEAKTIKAIYSEEPHREKNLSNIILLTSSALIICSLLFALTLAIRRWKHKIVYSLPIILIITSLISPLMQVQADENTDITKIKIQDTVWRYWYNSGSDTCIIWLGGGILTHQLFINPYYFESYNTMKFIQELAKFYSVLVIEEGSKTRFDKSLRREVHGEIYEGGKFLERARKWVIDSGYSNIYLMGYSVGGLAVYKEALLANPEHWSSPNGMILITTPLDKAVWSPANKLQGNLLILFGQGMPDYLLNSSREFFQRTPEEGIHEWGWVHKEFHLIPKVAHEVWTVAENGEYYPDSAWTVVRFIERSKVLSYDIMEKIETDDIKLKSEVAVEISVEPCLHLEEPIRLWLKITRLNPSNCTFVAKPLIDEVEPSLTMARYPCMLEGKALLSIPEAPNRPFKVIFYSLSEEVLDLGTYEVNRRIPLKITIITGFNGIPIIFDGVEYRTENDGSVSIKTSVGNHTIEVPKDIELNSRTRLFLKGTNSTIMTFDISGNMELPLLYVKQFLIEANSSMGIVNGDGWYDENSMMSLKIEPQIIEDKESFYQALKNRHPTTSEIYIFEGWEFEGGESVDGYIYVTSPIELEALWQRVKVPAYTDIEFSIMILILSITFFVAVLILGTKVVKIKE